MATMTKTVSVDVDLDLDDFEDDELLDELVSRGALTRTQADRVSGNEPVLTAGMVVIPADEIADILRDATAGRTHEALITLERCLGREFIGRLALSPTLDGRISATTTK